MMKIIIAGALAASLTGPVLAQDANSVPGAMMTVSAPATNILRAGTPVALKMSEGLTTKGKNLRVGQRFQMEVADAVTLNGEVIIPAGSPATGGVTEVRNKGMWGKSGAINARVLFVRVNGRQIRLTGQLDDKGITGTAGVVGAIAFVPVAGFLVTGTSAEIPMGAPVNAFVDEDVAITFSTGAAPQPLVVQTSPKPLPESE
jgi:hypothetical protein